MPPFSTPVTPNTPVSLLLRVERVLIPMAGANDECAAISAYVAASWFAYQQGMSGADFFAAIGCESPQFGYLREDLMQ